MSKPQEPGFFATYGHGSPFKFSVLTISSNQVKGDIHLQMADDLFGLRRLPFQLPVHWKEWVGSTEVRGIESSNLLLLRVRPDSAPHIQDEVTADLLNEAIALEASLERHGLVRKPKCSVLVGSHDGQEFQLHRSASSPRTVHLRSINYPDVDVEFLEQALARNSALAKICGRQGEYVRFVKALHSINFALREGDPMERCHHFVRGLECALHLPPNGKADAFAERVGEFFDASPRCITRLRDMYRVRNVQSHFLDFGVVPPFNEIQMPERRYYVSQLILYSELLSMAFLDRILMDSQLLPFFKDEAETERFWNLSRSDRKSLIEPPLSALSLRCKNKWNLSWRNHD